MASTSTGISNGIYWLALSLTPGLGPTRGRKLVERFGNVQEIFQASLTELEAENLQAQSAQHIALENLWSSRTMKPPKPSPAGFRCSVVRMRSGLRV